MHELAPPPLCHSSNDALEDGTGRKKRAHGCRGYQICSLDMIVFLDGWFCPTVKLASDVLLKLACTTRAELRKPSRMRQLSSCGVVPLIYGEGKDATQG
jgi:hypothetical protein